VGSGSGTVLGVADDRILTLHPAGKHGVRIARDKYDDMRAALLAVVPRDPAGAPFLALEELVEEHLDPALWVDAKVAWYLVTVKQDLEARGELELVPGVQPQHVRRTRETLGPTRHGRSPDRRRP
jgi:hypothetical protein